MDKYSPLEITMLIPTIEPRAEMLDSAIKSVQRQRFLPKEMVITTDQHKQGAASNRNLGVQRIRTEWTALMDDDDLLLPYHLEALTAAQHLTDADYVFSYYTVMDAQGLLCPDVDPLGHFGRPFDPSDPTQTTITILVRTELLRAHPFHEPTEDVPLGADGERLNSGEDWAFTLDCAKAGAKIVHVPMRTWLWRHHAGNTSGLPSRW